MLHTVWWCRQSKDIRSTEKCFRRNFERNDEHDRWTRNNRPQKIADAKVLCHVIVARTPAEDQIARTRKLGAQGFDCTVQCGHRQGHFRMPPPGDDVNRLARRGRHGVGLYRRCGAAATQPAECPDCDYAEKPIWRYWRQTKLRPVTRS